MQHSLLVSVVLLVWIATFTSATFSIDSYGGVANTNTNDAAHKNSLALTKAFEAANNAHSGEERTVLIPAGNQYLLFEVQLQNLYNVTLQIDGDLVCSNNITAWPLPTDRHMLAMIFIGNSSNVTVTGTGRVLGQGYEWWGYVFITGIDNRPCLFVMQTCKNIVFENIELKNSPYYHIFFSDMLDVVVQGISIIVDVTKQEELFKQYGHWDYEYSIPTFPLNTDGIDVAGKNILVQNVYVENYDDAICVKPSTPGTYANCSSNIVAKDSVVHFGVGLTIGSVPPEVGNNCIDGVIFDNITSHHPIKAIYVKTNPGTSGTGTINNITYSNIEINHSLWYPIWIGPQQEHQPHQQGKGCSFFYPIIPICPTQPLVTVSNISLINVSLQHGLTMPGVILCDSTNPCTGFNFTNVTNTGGFIVQQDYVCKNVFQSHSENCSPPVGCF